MPVDVRTHGPAFGRVVRKHGQPRGTLPSVFACVLLLGVCLAWPDAASAWTRTQVRGASAHIQVLDAPNAEITLALRIRISGGWLSELELPGLAPSIALDASKPAELVADTGERYVPEMVLRRGMWRAVFSNRHSAPWRGDYALTLVYREPLAMQRSAHDGRQQLRWSMPPWRLGIEDARISIDAPEDASPIDDPSTTLAVTRNVARAGDRTRIEHHRAQLPRDTEWTVGIELPTTGDVATPRSAAGATQGAPASNTWPSSMWLPALALVLALTKRALIRRHARAQAWRVKALLPVGSSPVRVLLMLALGVGASLLWSSHLIAAVITLALGIAVSMDRSFDATSGALTWRAADRAETSPAVWRRLGRAFTAHRWLDGTTPIGALTAASLLAVLTRFALQHPEQQRDFVLLGLLVAPLWMTATRWHMPWDGLQVARALSAWTHERRNAQVIAGCQQELLLGVDGLGQPRDARVALQAVAATSGLTSLDLTLVTDSRSMRTRVALFAQAQRGSAADKCLHAITVAARRSVAECVIHVVPTEHIADALARLTHTDLSRAISEPGRAAA